MFKQIQQAQVLLSIAKTSNFKATSLLCNVPNASSVIRQLETQIGIVLVNRNRLRAMKFIDDVEFGDCLTEYGKVLVPFAAAYASLYAEACKVVVEIHKKEEEGKAESQEPQKLQTTQKPQKHTLSPLPTPNPVPPTRYPLART